MAELDYAFLADYARVEPNGTLTSVGASFTFLLAEQLPSVTRLAVAGRVRSAVDDPPIALRVDVRGPGDVFKLALNAELGQGPSVRPYGDGRVGHLFALDLQVPLPSAGLYEVHIGLDGVETRRLAFEVAFPADQS